MVNGKEHRIFQVPFCSVNMNMHVFLSYEMKTCNDQRAYLGKKTPNFLKLIFFSASKFFML